MVHAPDLKFGLCRFESGRPHQITMRTIDDIILGRVPAGWTWCVYGPSSTYKARAVLVCPNYRIHIGREGRTVEEALKIAARDARSGLKE